MDDDDFLAYGLAGGLLSLTAIGVMIEQLGVDRRAVSERIDLTLLSLEKRQGATDRSEVYRRARILIEDTLDRLEGRPRAPG